MYALIIRYIVIIMFWLWTIRQPGRSVIGNPHFEFRSGSHHGGRRVLTLSLALFSYPWGPSGTLFSDEERHRQLHKRQILVHGSGVFEVRKTSSVFLVQIACWKSNHRPSFISEPRQEWTGHKSSGQNPSAHLSEPPQPQARSGHHFWEVHLATISKLAPCVKVGTCHCH